jgi:hypothetical protein
VADIFKLLEDNFSLLFGLAVLWVVAWSAYSAWRRYQRGPTHPPFSEHDVRFTERFASGFSHKNLFTRFGGAHNALVIRVLKDALLIEPIGIFKWITPAGFNDLEHYVPRKDIFGVQPASSFGRETLQVHFRAKDGQQHTIELALRRPQEFKAALNA